LRSALTCLEANKTLAKIMSYFWYLALFVFGLTIGSFINVVSLRYQPGRRVFDTKVIGGPTDWNNRSHCPHCGKILNWYELIPIFSFLIQFGKCRTCSHKLSFQYPIVEILSGLIFIFIPYHFGFYSGHSGAFGFFGSVLWIIIFILFLLLSIIDLRHMIIPNSLNLSLAVLGAINIFINNYYQKFDFLAGSFLRSYAPIFGLRSNIWFNYLFASFFAIAIFSLIIFFSRGRAMGLGDLKLVAALGLIFGWPDILMVLFLAFIIGALVSVVFLIIGKKKIKDMVPFGPFLIIGATLTFFFGYQIISGYFKLFGI